MGPERHGLSKLKGCLKSAPESSACAFGLVVKTFRTKWMLLLFLKLLSLKEVHQQGSSSVGLYGVL
jgi:hypothetical protein